MTEPTLDDILNPDKCPECNGAGMVNMAMGSIICPKCKGTGKKPKEDSEDTPQGTDK